METGIDVGGVDLGTAISLLAGAVAVVVAMTVVLAIIKSFLYICRPNEILIFAGRRHTLPDGSSVGYKVVRSGWAVRTPLLETVSRMDMRLIMVEVSVTNAYSGGGIPLDVKAIANVKIANDPSHVRNYAQPEWESFFELAGLQVADERFMHRPLEIEPWLARVDCVGADAARVRELLGDRVVDGVMPLPTLVLRGVK